MIKALTGVSASGVITNPGPDISLPLVSVSAQGLTDKVTVPQPITAVTANGLVGTVNTGSTNTVALTGVSASGAVNTFYNAYWQEINTNDVPQWELIDTV